MDIAISSVSPLPLGGYPPERAMPDTQGFGELLRGGDPSPPSGVETVEAGPSGRPAQGSHRTGGDDFGTTDGAAAPPLLPSVPLVTGQQQPPIPETQTKSPSRPSDGGQEPLPAMQPLGGGGIRHHKALVVAAGMAGGFEGAGAALFGAPDETVGATLSSHGLGDAGVQRTDAKVVAFRMTPPGEGSEKDLVAIGGLEPPSVGGSGLGSGEVGSVHRDTSRRPSEPPGSGSNELPPPGTKETLDSLTQQAGTGDVRRLEAKVVAAAVLDRTSFASGGGLLERSSGGSERIEPTPGSVPARHQSRVLGMPVTDVASDQARQEGLELGVRNDHSRLPTDLPDTDVQRHRATVVAAGVEPPEDGLSLDGLPRPDGDRLVTAQRGASTEASGGTAKPAAYGVQTLPNEVTLPEVFGNGRNTIRETTADQASASVERAHTSVRPAAVVTAVAAYGGSEVRAPAQPFPRLDYWF